MNPRGRVVAVIQARMGSSRFPGKVLAPLAGQPLLWHLLQRLRRCRTLDAIVVATTTAAADDALAAWAAAQGVSVVRGPEDDVLARFALAAEASQADIVLRVTGDAPLIDPGLIDALVEALCTSGAEHALGRAGFATLHEGIDPFTRGALQRLLDEAGDDPLAREHVSAWFKQHPQRVRTAWVDIEPRHANPLGARLSVDTPADLAFLEAVYAALGVAAGEADLAAVGRLLQAHPELLALNAHVRQKAASARSHRVLIRCDGGGALGLGHVVRCLAIADELREREGCGVRFALGGTAVAAEQVRAAGFPLDLISGEEAAWLDGLIARQRPDALLLDVRSALTPAALARWRAHCRIVLLDDASARRQAADLLFYPLPPSFDGRELSGACCSGWSWLPLRRQFAGQPPAATHTSPRLLVTMGGSDPAGLSLLAVEALERLPADCQPLLVLGRDFQHAEALAAQLAGSRRAWQVERDVADMATLMRSADLALIAYGGTAHELAALGVPALYLCLDADHAASAAVCAAAGFGVSLGRAAALDAAAIAAAVAALLADGPRRQRMAQAGRAAIDGGGAARIAARIVQCIEQPRRAAA
ncbi:cytidylyltransferase domain-containing protein [Plasticicumulans acidivorans]|uniref:Spore coat polysaccharide biosynthesis protein SpsF n=1 Tax=Plasticicumulans acidivorans TaxID=886464 RepID=A0A317MWN2_9GAMM|nr:NTP transferase domain-containing protein [Plasticicumulans acidivorans]PWV63306.1 spore coat polysaccharide biosynthesis protein SpsF [Plasticicumulans acidivorans]